MIIPNAPVVVILLALRPDTEASSVMFENLCGR